MKMNLQNVQEPLPGRLPHAHSLAKSKKDPEFKDQWFSVGLKASLVFSLTAAIFPQTEINKLFTSTHIFKPPFLYTSILSFSRFAALFDDGEV